MVFLINRRLIQVQGASNKNNNRYMYNNKVTKLLPAKQPYTVYTYIKHRTKFTAEIVRTLQGSRCQQISKQC